MASSTVRSFPVFVFPMSGAEGFEHWVTMSWEEDDPWAVKLQVTASGKTVLWMFARELLWAGMDMPAGEGDVRISPGVPAGFNADDVEISLTGTGGTARLVFDYQDLLEFLEETRSLFLAAIQTEAA